MKSSICLFLSIATLTLIFSCNKNTEIAPDPKPALNNVVQYSDSISFSINHEQYVFSQWRSKGIGNYAINIKPFSSKLPDRKLAYETGGYFWQGVSDSTLYSTFVGYDNFFKLEFAKKYRDGQLQRKGSFLVPTSLLDIFKKGKLPFATDLGMENTTEGVFIELNVGQGKRLITSIPGFSIIDRSTLKNDLQRNSIFEITKVEKIDNDLRDDLYLIEAKFELNLYDDNEELHRVTNGFIRMKVNHTATYL